jgi:hypothetical protein
MRGHGSHAKLSIRRGNDGRGGRRPVERKKRVNLGTEQVDATEVGFRSSGENWNEYLVDDGTVVRMKLVVTEILRIDDRYDHEGNPQYFVKSTNVVAVSAPEHLRRENS